MLRSTRSFVLLCVLVSAWVGPAFAAGTEKKEPPRTTAESLYDEGLRLSEEGRFAAALVKFEEAHAEDPQDPEVLNMLAHSLRKVGRLDEAFTMYEKALELRERFPQAREYLGEAHLQAALLQIQVLRSYGPEAEKELAALLDALARAANEALGADFEVEPARW